MLVHNICDIVGIRDQIRNAATATRQNTLHDLHINGMRALATLKFGANGNHPWRNGGWNIIEQVNQSFTIMASLAAAEYLLDRFGNFGGLHLNPGARQGRDLISHQPQILAIEVEVFTCGEGYFRRKLRNDTRRFIGANADHCFVFFYCPVLFQGNPRQGRQFDLEEAYALGDQGPEVEIWALNRQTLF